MPGSSDDDVGGRSAGRHNPPDPHPGATAPAHRPDTTALGGWRQMVVDVVSSVVAVGLLGLLLFATSGVWPPLVAVESGSMEPHMTRGDLVFVMEESRFPGPDAHTATGVTPLQAATGTDYQRFGAAGDVVVYRPDGTDGSVTSPIIHRARFWVEDGEDWYDRADTDYIGGATSCVSLPNCPAPNAGFITKGDANGRYDQVNRFPGCSGECSPVKPAWILGTAEASVPFLGLVRLRTAEARPTTAPPPAIGTQVTAANQPTNQTGAPACERPAHASAAG
jgi:signal peptidase